MLAQPASFSGHEVASRPKKMRRKKPAVESVSFRKIDDGSIIASKNFKNDDPGPWISSKDEVVADGAAATTLLKTCLGLK